MSAPHAFDIICFDCDSTLSRIEGIDELAVRAGCVAAVEPLTAAAMDGTLTIEQVYARRLDLIKPDNAAIDWVAERYVAEIVPGAADVIAALHALGKSIHVVSGGLLQPVLHLALALGVARDNVHAVAIDFAPDGSYRGFDTGSPLTRASGKAEIAARLAAQSGGLVALVGDGVTDVAARKGGAYIVGFGGVVARPAVVDGADIFIAGPSLLATLDALLTVSERAAVHLHSGL